MINDRKTIKKADQLNSYLYKTNIVLQIDRCGAFWEDRNSIIDRHVAVNYYPKNDR